MKKKLSKIFGIGLSLVLVLAMAGPLLADFSEPVVDVDPDTIDTEADYTIIFTLGEELEVGDTITVRFPDDTDVPAADLVTADFDVSAGSGAIGGTWKVATVAGMQAAAVTDDDDLTVIFTLAGADEIGAGATVVIAFLKAGTNSITNPTEAGDYTLEVKTSEEDDYVESAVYEIDVPEVGGGVYIRNSASVLMDTFGGDAALNDAQTGGWFAAAYEDYTIEVGPGVYVLTADITISGEGITLVSTDGAATTEIDADGNGLVIGADEVTIDGFTIDDADTAVDIGAFDDAVVQNCEITDATVAGVNIVTGGEDSVIQDNVIEDCATGILFAAGASDVTVENNEITEANTNGAIVFTGANNDNTITGNTITDNDVSGIVFLAGGAVSDDTLIEENDISTNDGHGIHIATVNAPTGLEIMGNDINENDDDGISLASWSDTGVICFNNIVDNDDDAIDNIAGACGAIDATLNWWGTDDSDDIDDEFEDEDSDDDFEPFLTDAVDTIFTGYNVAAGDDELDAEDEAGVEISDIIDVGTDVADRIKAAAYADNPEGEDPEDPAVAYYDVYVGYTADDAADNAGTADAMLFEADVTMLLKLHVSGINDDMVAYAWSTTQESWVECSDQAVSEYGGYVVVTIEDDTEPALDELTGTTFAVVQGEASAAGIPTLESPDYGAEDVGLNPTFAWGTVEDADEYVLQVSTNQFFVDATEKSPLTHTVWRWDTTLENSTTYYWRVQAIDDGGESDWAEAVFTTKAAPVAPPAPPAVLYTCPTCGLSFDTPEELQAHWAAVHVPPAPTPEPLPTTPAYIWVIIAVGAVLVIAVIVLIVRTRRVA